MPNQHDREQNVPNQLHAAKSAPRGPAFHMRLGQGAPHPRSRPDRTTPRGRVREEEPQPRPTWPHAGDAAGKLSCGRSGHAEGQPRRRSSPGAPLGFPEPLPRPPRTAHLPAAVAPAQQHRPRLRAAEGLTGQKLVQGHGSVQKVTPALLLTVCHKSLDVVFLFSETLGQSGADTARLTQQSPDWFTNLSPRRLGDQECL